MQPQPKILPAEDDEVDAMAVDRARADASIEHELGADGYSVKPVDFDRFVEVMSMLCRFGSAAATAERRVTERIPRSSQVRPPEYNAGVGGPLIFITGASSGIGLAMARTAPFEGARVIDVSRRGGEHLEHFAADLADPDSWPATAALFEKEMAGFEGERVVLVHSAGTLDPIGFAGEVDAESYARQAVLNAAAPMALGDAFLRAAQGTSAPCTLLFIGSGASTSVYEGWSAYCGGKAAVDHWVRTVGAEQKRRGDRCRVVCVAPGVVETAMQEQIRAMNEDAFPQVERFRLLHRQGALRDADDAARDLWAIVESDTFPNGSVLDLRG